MDLSKSISPECYSVVMINRGHTIYPTNASLIRGLLAEILLPIFDCDLHASYVWQTFPLHSQPYAFTITPSSSSNVWNIPQILALGFGEKNLRTDLFHRAKEDARLLYRASPFRYPGAVYNTPMA